MTSTSAQLPHRRRLLAIANPISGRGRARKLAPDLKRLAELSGVHIELRMTERAGHGRELAAAAAGEGFNGVVCVGGDGTVNEVVNGIGAHGLPFLLVPQGTGNVLGKELRATNRLERYVGALRDWRLKQRDLGRLNDGRLFACFVGAGFDGQCTRALHERGRTMRMSEWVPIMWKAIKDSDFRTLRLECGASGTREGVSYALVSITSGYGGPLWLTADAIPDDGLFDILTMHKPVKPLSVTRVLVYAFFRQLKRVPFARFTRAPKVRVTADEKVPIQMDGEFAGYLPIECEVLPGAMRYFAPE
jgi:diacylglycerol kinase (ATP)